MVPPKGNSIPSFSTLVEMLRLWAGRMENRPLYTFLEDGETQEKTYTYRDLEVQARRIGAFLQTVIGKKTPITHHPSPTTDASPPRALLLYEPGLEYIAAFFGCLFSGVIAVPAYPPDPYRLARTLPRLKSILKDSRAKWVLTTENIRSMAQAVFQEDAELKSLQWQATDLIREGMESEWKEPEIDDQSLAFLQYTSGSTGTPKGVMLSHGNLLYNLKLIREAFEIPEYEKGKGVSWLPPYHDMGLIGGILGPLYAGASSILMSPLAFLQKPLNWLRAISRHRGLISGGPNFAYEMCVRKITPEERETLDLSHWGLAFSGAEPVRAATLDRFAQYFAPAGFRKEAFYPCYGLAEGTLIVSGGKKSEAPVVRRFSREALKEHRALEMLGNDTNAKEFVGCGQNLPGQTIQIVEPETIRVCEKGELGEIWVSGPSIAQGYWKREELSEKVFRARIGEKEENIEKRFLRTGDLGFFHEGELFIAERLKDLIIIRGQNHYPHDLELTAEKAHLSLRAGCGAAFSFEQGGEERLVIVQELERTALANNPSLNLEKITQDVRQALAEQHEVEVYAVSLIKAGSIPKTSSGKISRYATREAFLTGGLELVYQWKKNSSEKSEAMDLPEETARSASSFSSKSKKSESIEQWMVEQVSQRLSLSPEAVDPRQLFSRYGLDSKELVGLSGDLESYLGKKLSPTLLWQYPTIEALALHLASDQEVALKDKKARKGSGPGEPIAVIGMACSFPKAENSSAFWKMLCEGRDAVTEVAADRWEADRFYSSEPAEKGKMNTRWGGFLDSVEGFDANFFGISPRGEPDGPAATPPLGSRLGGLRGRGHSRPNPLRVIHRSFRGHLQQRLFEIPMGRSPAHRCLRRNRKCPQHRCQPPLLSFRSPGPLDGGGHGLLFLLSRRSSGLPEPPPGRVGSCCGGRGESYFDSRSDHRLLPGANDVSERALRHLRRRCGRLCARRRLRSGHFKKTFSGGERR